MSILQTVEIRTIKEEQKHHFLCFLSRLIISPFPANVPIWYTLKTLVFFLFSGRIMQEKIPHRRVNFERNNNYCERQMFIFYTTLKTPGKQRLFGVHRGYKMGTFARNELKRCSPRKSNICKKKISFVYFVLHSHVFGYDTIPFSKSSFFMENSTNLAGFYMIRVFTETYF